MRDGGPTAIQTDPVVTATVPQSILGDPLGNVIPLIGSNWTSGRKNSDIRPNHPKPRR